MKPGDKVLIARRKRTLVRPLAIKDGWEINKPVEGFRFWNMAEMKPLSKTSEQKQQS